MKVKEIMTKNPIVSTGKTPIAQIEEIFRKYKIWSVLIEDAQKNGIGIITKSDLKRRIKNRYSTPAYAIMSKNFVSVYPDDDVERAKALLYEKNVNGLPVIKNGKFCGILTRYDIQTKYPTGITGEALVGRTQGPPSGKPEIPNPDGDATSLPHKKFFVFISYINENFNIANKFKTLIIDTFPKNVEVFIAGDPDNIPFSKDWFEGIKEGIKNCDLMIILCTPESVRRPWINFEAGAATLLEKNVGPICFAGQKVGQLPSPLNYIRSQAIDCSDDESFKQHFKKFIETIATQIGVSAPTIDVLNSDFYRSIKSEKRSNVSTEKESERANSDQKIRVIKNQGQTIFIPMQGLLQSDQDFFKRGYNIESYFLLHLNQTNHLNNFDFTPNALLKRLKHDPDPILQKYIAEIKGLCDEYDTFSERLDIINKDIFEKRPVVWGEFVKLCDHLNSPSMNLPNKEDYISLLALTIADPEPPRKSFHMGDFYDKHKDALRSFILNSPLEKDIREYTKLREKFFEFSDRFLQVLTNLTNDWLRIYLLIESDLQPQFSPI